MATVRGGEGVVQPQVQALADALAEKVGAESFGTYNGHDPSIDLALDVFTPTDSAELGNRICVFAAKNWERFGLRYMIYRQRIYNPEVADYWRAMTDRGSLTQNHFDHVHFTFRAGFTYVVEASQAGPQPQPPQRKEVTMLLFSTPTQDGTGKTFLLPGGHAEPVYLAVQADVDAFSKAVPYIGEISNALALALGADL